MRWSVSLRCVALALLVWVLYANTLHSPFVFDDFQNIRHNVAIRLENFNSLSLRRLLTVSHAVHRPVANASFALHYYLHRYDVVGYHVVNILIHITTGLLLYCFVDMTLHLPGAHRREESAAGIAFGTALLWLVHPLQTQSVTYIVQRMTSMAALFYLLALVLYVKARLSQVTQIRFILWAGCLLATVLAFGSKEIAATLPFFLLLYEWYFFQDLRRASLRRGGLWAAEILGALGLLAWMYLGGRPWDAILLGYESLDFTLYERVLTEWRVIFFYLRLWLWPHPSHLTLEHDFPLSYGILDPPSTLLALVGIVGVLGFAVVRARQHRLLSFGVLWFLGNLAIESSVIGLEILFEHRLYLPSMLLCWLFVAAVYASIKPAWLRAGCLGVVVLVCMVWTYERNQVWRDEVTLWEDCIAKAPHKSRPYVNLFNALQRQGRHEEAAPYYDAALKLAAGSVGMSLQLGGQFRDQRMFAAAIEQLTAGLALKPTSASLHTFLGTVLAEEGKLDEAIEHYTAALRSYPRFADAHYHLGDAFLRQGKVALAWQSNNAALSYNSAMAPARYRKGELLMAMDKIPEAIHQYRAALQFDPTLPEAHAHLGQAFAQQGDSVQARYHYATAISLAREASRLSEDENVSMLLRLLRIYETAGQLSDAREVAQQVLTRAQDLGIPALASDIQAWLEKNQ